MRRIVLMLVCLALLAAPAAAAYPVDPGGGGNCYWTWDHRFVCLP